jgi:hypothetical protein
MDLTNGQETETELCFQIVSADVANNDAVQMRLTRDGGVLLTTYTRTLSITVSESTAITGDLSVTLASLALTADGVADVQGTAALTLDVLALSGAAVVDVVGTADNTLSALTLTGVAAVDGVGILEVTLAALSLTADGVVLTRRLRATSA